MSKTKPEKVEVRFDDFPELEELGFVDNLKEYRRLSLEQSFHTAKAEKYKTDKESYGKALQDSIKEIGADTVITEIDGLPWRSTLAKSPERISEEKLRKSLVKIAKLDAVTIAKIIAAAKNDGTPYIRVTVGSGNGE